MKYILAFFSLFLIFSCDDGDLTIETIDFDSATIENCDTATVDTTIFFKLNEKEALILTLEAGLLENVVSTETITSSLDSGSELIYRVFSDKISSTYFCSTIPPSTPSVLEEITALSGTVTITTVTGTEANTFTHTITIKDSSFMRDNGERITDLTTSDFGSVTTTAPTTP